MLSVEASERKLVSTSHGDRWGGGGGFLSSHRQIKHKSTSTTFVQTPEFEPLGGTEQTQLRCALTADAESLLVGEEHEQVRQATLQHSRRQFFTFLSAENDGSADAPEHGR